MLAFSKDYVLLNYEKTGHSVYLQIAKTRTVREQSDEAPKKKRATVLGVGVDGGFEADAAKHDEHVQYNIVVLPNFDTFPYPSDQLPARVQQSAMSVIENDGVARQEDVAKWVDDEERPVS